MSTGAPERVFPNPAAAPAGPAKTGGGNPLAGLNQKTLMWGGAAVVAVVALVAGSRGGGSDPEAAGEAGDAPYELDTRDTDLYNELQPELENIQDQLLDLSKPPKPTPAQPGTPTQPTSGPKPYGGPAVSRVYRVRNGDTLASIAKRLKVRGGRARLYAVNRKIIERAAKQHGRKNSGGGRYIYAGTTLVIP